MVTKISRISGISRVDEGQYIGSSGARTLNLFKLVKLYKGTPRELFTRHPHDCVGHWNRCI